MGDMQHKHNMKFISRGPYTEDTQVIEIPAGKVWEIYGFRLQLSPVSNGDRRVFVSVEFLTNPVFEGVTPTLTITGAPQAGPAVFTGLRGVPTAVIPSGTYSGEHANFQLPDRVVLPELSRIVATVDADPDVTDERKLLFLLVDESATLPSP